MQALDPDVVLVKGDLTCNGTDEEYAQFLAAYGQPFGDRARPRARQPRRVPRRHLRGRAGRSGSTCRAPPWPRSTPPTRARPRAASPPSRSSGSTTWPARPTGPCWCSATTTCGAPTRSSGPRRYFGILPDSSERLVEVVARHPGILGYFAGHTHRNRVRRISVHRRPAVGGGGVREGLPGHLGRVPGARARRPAGPPAHLHARGARRGPSRPGTCTPTPTRTTRSARSTSAASPCSLRHERASRRAPGRPAGGHPRPRPGHGDRRTGGRPLPRRLRRRRPQDRAARAPATARAGWALPDPADGTSLYWKIITRNKRCATLDLKSDAGRERGARARRGRPRPHRELPARAPSSASGSARTCCSSATRSSSSSA